MRPKESKSRGQTWFVMMTKSIIKLIAYSEDKWAFPMANGSIQELAQELALNSRAQMCIAVPNQSAEVFEIFCNDFIPCWLYVQNVLRRKNLSSAQCHNMSDLVSIDLQYHSLVINWRVTNTQTSLAKITEMTKLVQPWNGLHKDS